MRTDHQNTIIPPFARLERYQMDISLYTAENPNFGSSRLPHPIRAMQVLGSLTPSHFLATPRLKTIYCPPHVDFQRSSGRLGPDIPRWNEHAFQGALVYSFGALEENINRAVSPQEDNELLLIRLHLCTSNVPCRGQRCIVCPMGWEDKAWWRGREIPVNVVSAAFAADSFDIMATPPSRGRVMGQKGWDVLRYWADGGACDY
jgi:hypothetical protein